MAQARVPVFFAVSIDIYDTNILTCLGGIAPLGDPPPENQFFERFVLRCQCYLISAVAILETNTLT